MAILKAKEMFQVDRKEDSTPMESKVRGSTVQEKGASTILT